MRAVAVALLAVIAVGVGYLGWAEYDRRQAAQAARDFQTLRNAMLFYGDLCFAARRRGEDSPACESFRDALSERPSLSDPSDAQRWGIKVEGNRGTLMPSHD